MYAFFFVETMGFGIRTIEVLLWNSKPYHCATPATVDLKVYIKNINTYGGLCVIVTTLTETTTTVGSNFANLTRFTAFGGWITLIEQAIVFFCSE